MSDNTHKRSKSAIAKSLLQRVSSKQDVHTLDSSAESPRVSLDHQSSAAGSDSPSSSSLSPPTFSQSRMSQSGNRPSHLATTMSPPAAVDGPGAEQDQAAAATSSSIPQGTSIEQSVKLFKVFEALRGGDTNALSTVIGGNASEGGGSKLEGTTVLHLAVQVAEPSMVEYILRTSATQEDINARDKEGNTPLHIASMLGRSHVVKALLDQPTANDSVTNFGGKTPLDLARTPEVYQQLQLARSIFVDAKVKKIQELVQSGSYGDLENMLADPRIRATIDVNGAELATESQTVESGGSLLHEAARKRDVKLAQMLLLNGADPFRRDRKGKLPQDVTKDDRTRAILKKSPAAAAAQRGVQEKAILGSSASQVRGSAPGEVSLSAKEAREMKGYLKKWTNYTSGYKLRWFVLEDGVLSYYKHQDDAGSACRGAINMRIAALHMDPKEKLSFEIHGKSSVKYHLRANHQAEAKRWFWALNNAIQWSKDEAKDEQRRQRGNEALKQARTEHTVAGEFDSASTLVPGTAVGVPTTSLSARGSISAMGDNEGSTYEPSTAGDEIAQVISRANTATIEGELDDEDEDFGDDASGHEVPATNKDAFNITAQSAKLQLDLLLQVSGALQQEKSQNPELTLSHPSVEHALTSYDSAAKNLRGLLLDLLRISRDHESYWQYRLERESNVRRLWEESMARVAKEQEELQGRIGESEDKRKKTKRALREVLEGQATASAGSRSRAATQDPSKLEEAVSNISLNEDGKAAGVATPRRKMTLSEYTNHELSDDESDMDDEFFDAVDAGEVRVEEMPAIISRPATSADGTSTTKNEERKMAIEKSYRGYEDGVRKRLKLDADNRPKVSLWAVLKSMIGKDMTKMTLPVSFNEPTSLLYRVVEDMEYTDLLDAAAERSESTERMVYVAAFAASEYASTIGRVAKPFNPLLGETYEYVRPDKGYRFFIEQVSHHPPIGAAIAESAKWTYEGESSVKSKFYGKSFEFNPLGTWFLRLRPDSGEPEELYTWKKVTSSVVGIITGNPQVDNYGPMEIKNWTTGETCILDFKARGWKANSAYHVSGRVLDRDRNTCFSIGGRWNDKIYARLTPGYEGTVLPPDSSAKDKDSNQAFLVWEASARPQGIPFNLTPFAVTLNALPDRLRPFLAPTDTRLRPDQRAMEDGEYDLAATEKLRVEEKQRAKRRQREQAGEEFVPKWFTREKHPVTGEPYWRFRDDEYWSTRDKVVEGAIGWDGVGCEDIF